MEAVPVGQQEVRAAESLNDIQDYLENFNKEIQEAAVPNQAGFQTQQFPDGNQQFQAFTQEVGQGDFVQQPGEQDQFFDAQQILQDQAVVASSSNTDAGVASAISTIAVASTTSTQQLETIAQNVLQTMGNVQHAQSSAVVPKLEVGGVGDVMQGSVVIKKQEEGIEDAGGQRIIIHQPQGLVSQDGQPLAIKTVSSGREGQISLLAANNKQTSQSLIVSQAGDLPQIIVQDGQPIDSQPQVVIQTESQELAPHDQSALENSVVQVLQSVGAAQTSTVQTEGEVLNIQDAQLVAVQNAQDSSQPQLVAVQRSSNEVDQSSLEMLASASQQGTEAATSQENAVVLNSNGNQYQTVTIVPSEVNQGGEVSYVLIVSQPDDKNKEGEDVDLSVYDFKEEPKEAVEEGEESDEDANHQKKIIKYLAQKKAPPSSQLMCNYCNYTSPKKYLLTRHMKTHSEERPHKCSKCERGFKTIASLQNHENTHTGTKPHKCKECTAAFTTSGELVRHVRYRHTHEKPHRCTECDYASVELSKLKRHMRSHTGERPYSCPHCPYASPDTYKLKRHLRIHTGEKPYECNVCHTRFTQSNSLKAHALIHSGAKPVYQCELCPTTCGRKTDLKIHIQKLHTSDKPLQCKKCNKSFPDRYTYKIHMKTHDGEKCFKCELCPYAALSERHLQSHVLTHTGEKPFECDMCDQAFRQKQLLKRHKNLYHTPDYQPPTPREKTHECSECEKQFAHKGNLLRHMALHDPESPMYQPLAQLRAKRAAGLDDSEEEEEDEDEDGQMQVAVAGDGSTQGKTVMIEVTQEGSDQQMYLLMEVPSTDGIVQAGEAIEGDTGVPEGVEEAAPVASDGEELEPPVLEMETPLAPRRGRRARKGPETTPKLEREVEPEDPEVSSPEKKRTRRQSKKDEGEAQVSEVAENASPARVTRGKAKQTDSPEEPALKKIKRESPRKKKKEDGEEVGEEDKRREEQIRKDIEECFGFEMDEEAES